MFQRRHVVFVVEHGFVVARRFCINLIQETLRLVFRIVQLAKAIADFTTADKELEAVSDFRSHHYDAPAETLQPDIR